MTTMELEAQWHNDGHKIAVQINIDRTHIVLDWCPNLDQEDTECWSAEADGCIVRWFIEVWGLDINVGTAPAAAIMEVAWSAQRGGDLTSSQVWIIPIEDEAFSGWITEQLNPEDEETS